MSIHFIPPRQWPPLAKLAKMMLDGLSLLEMAVRCERRQRQRDIAQLREEIEALKQQRESGNEHR